jgi:hypothetical protein
LPEGVGEFVDEPIWQSVGGGRALDANKNSLAHPSTASAVTPTSSG